MTVAHWDDVEGRFREAGHIGATWTYLGEAAGSVGVGVRRVAVPSGRWSTAAHTHGREEEIFFVLAGAGLSWQDGRTYEIRAGDCLVHLTGGPAHTVQGGADGIDLLAFGLRRPDDACTLPRAGAGWFGSGSVALAAEDPWQLEAAAGPPETPPPSPRPATIVHLDEAESGFGGTVRWLARGAARASGLNWCALPPHEEGSPPHCHSLEEELFVVLDGEGVLELWAPPTPGAPFQTEPQETVPVRRGHVVSRPPGTRISHSFRAGAAGLTYLAYGTREPGDACYYPRSNKVFFRGLGLIARLEPLEYGDGEPG